MDSALQIITMVGSLCSAIIVIITFLGFIFKWPFKIVNKYYEDHTKQIIDNKVNEVKTMIEDLSNTVSKDQIATIATLRHDITYIYEKYKDAKVLPGNTKKDICSLYETYTDLGGNSYVHEIYEEMMKWETK
jgi:hypothetical protein